MQHAGTLVAGRRTWRRGDVARVGATAITVAVTLAATLTGATLRLTSESGAAEDVAVGRAPAGAAALPASPPVSVRIPAIDLTTGRIVALGSAPSGAMEVPAAAATVGWLHTGVTPGESGAAVLAGHRELGYAHAVFHAVPELRPGDTVTVTRADGSTVPFDVYRVEHTAGIPTALESATAPTGRPELRLVTWARHDPGEHATARSVVVFAARAAPATRDPVTTGR